MKEKIKQFFRKYKDKLSARLAKSPTYVKFLKKRGELAEWMRLKILAFFTYISPVWIFLCVKTNDPDLASDGPNGFSQVIQKKLIATVF